MSGDAIKAMGPLDVWFIYGDWTYCTDTEEEDDNRKINHYAMGRETREIDFTPYQRIDRETFAKIVDLGFPERRGSCALCADDVNEMFKERENAGI